MNIGVVGIGLIGGSLALALRATGHHVLGIDIDERSRNEAVRRGVVDDATSELSALRSVELVIIAAPLGATVRVASELLPLLAPGTIVTDTASVKGAIVDAILPNVPAGISYVGGHPMFGVERRGVDAASAELVQQAPFILTPRTDSDDRALTILRDLVVSIGMVPVVLSTQEHDVQLSVLSHVPQLLAVALSLNASDTSCAGPSFRGSTRTAMSPPENLLETVRMNRAAIKTAIASLTATLEQLSLAPDEELRHHLEEARRRRLHLERDRTKNGTIR